MVSNFSFMNIDRSNIITEQSNPNSKEIDNVTTSELVEIFIQEDKKPQEALSNASKEIINSIDLITERLKNNGRLFYIGAGTSGRLAVLDSAECPPTFCTNPDLVQAIIAGGLNSMINSSETLEDNKKLSIEELKTRGFSSKDCLIGITAGGTTPFVLGALNYAKDIDALTIAITCVPEDQVNFDSHITIRLITGPELITGSTRLKAATATKMALNIISTGVMIKLGKVFGNKMIDFSINNSKLLDRGVRIMKEILEIETEEALELLQKSNGSVKISCLIKLSRLSYEQSKELLLKSEGSLRKALTKIGKDIKDIL